MKRVLSLFNSLVVILIILIALSVFTTNLNINFPFRFYSVNSSSMRPNIPLGSLIMISEQNDYQVGDIITFHSETSLKQTVTHRIVEIVEDPDINKLNYKTKGDANEDPDYESIPKTRVLGKVVLTIPFLGYPIGFAKTKTGFMVLVMVPLLMIAYSEVSTIKKELIKSIKKKGDQEKKD